MKRQAPTIIDVAERAGVSKSLVSLVMRGADNVSDERRAAVLAAAEELGYRPNAVARSLVQRRTFVLGGLVSNFLNPFFAEVIEGIEHAAVAADYRALFMTGSRDPDRELLALDTLLQLRTDGLLLASPRFDDAELDRIPQGLPAVVIGREAASDAVDTVTNDDRAGAALVVDHLVDLGHRRIAHVVGDSEPGGRERAAGFVDAMTAHDLEPVTVDGGFTEAAGVRAATALLELDELPTAIFAANDVAAMGVMQVVEEAGLRVPDDVSLVGYDNVRFTRLNHIDLTTVDQPRRELGRLAVDLLLERIDGSRTEPRHVTVEPHLVTRTTTAPPREGA